VSAIWKYPIVINDVVDVDLPIGSNPLHFAEQDGILCLWAAVHPKQLGKLPRRFHIVGTGHEIPMDAGKYLCTVLTQGGMFVWHIFDSGVVI
jgi:hypothetical protein